jgi:hypothetical protein
VVFTAEALQAFVGRGRAGSEEAGQ